MRIRKITQNTRDFNITDAVTDGGTDLNKTTFNGLQDNVEDAISTNIKTVDYITEYPQLPSNNPKYKHIITSEPDGYSLLCYVIKSNTYKSQVFQSIIDSTPTTCGVNLYNYAEAPLDVTITITGIYIKTS